MKKSNKEEAKIRAEIIMSLKEGYKQKMKKTAVEWVLDWMSKNQYFIGNDLLKAVEQAKEMEREQIIDFGYDIADDLACGKYRDKKAMEERYNEYLTFKQQSVTDETL
jgi:hypothetical protein